MTTPAFEQILEDWEKRMQERQEQEDKELTEQAEQRRQDYLWRTKRSELRP